MKVTRTELQVEGGGEFIYFAYSEWKGTIR